MDLNELKHQSVDGIPRISYKELGNGPPVIFLHGIGGNHSNWYDQQSYISDNFTTIAWDARGYGDSDDYNGPLNFSDFGEDLIRLLDARNISKAHFVGLSMGARILMDFFPKHRSRVATLILCDCFFDSVGELFSRWWVLLGCFFESPFASFRDTELPSK